jgi:FixJ family two-component response regulator
MISNAPAAGDAVILCDPLASRFFPWLPLFGTAKLEPDIVLADFAMPEMSGVELARAIHDARPGLPAIVVTGHGDHKLPEEGGESRILQKSSTERDLVDKITAAS